MMQKTRRRHWRHAWRVTDCATSALIKTNGIFSKYPKKKTSWFLLHFDALPTIYYMSVKWSRFCGIFSCYGELRKTRQQRRRRRQAPCACGVPSGSYATIFSSARTILGGHTAIINLSKYNVWHIKLSNQLTMHLHFPSVLCHKCLASFGFRSSG